MSDKRFQLTRRKALTGLGGIGAGAALGGTGTMAFLRDTETSKDNMMTAGKLDLKLDWYWFYQGAKFEQDYQPKTNDAGPMFQLKDVKPGDYGCGVISVHVKGNPAHVWFRTKNAEEKEHYRKEPEKKVDKTDKKAELAENVKFVAAPLGCVKDQNYEGKETAKGKLPHDSGSRPSMDDWTTDETEAKNSDKNYCISKGTLADVLYEMKCGTYLPTHGKNKTCLYGFCWWIPKKVGNEIQSDSVTFDMEFYAEQKRHNEKPSNPWGSGKIDLDEKHSPGTEYNEEDGKTEPYITWDSGEEKAKFTFHNPTDHHYSFDYRVDGEPGKTDQWSGDTISEGPLKGQKFGKRYNAVTVGPKEKKTVYIAACDSIGVILRRGAEQHNYIPWIRFDVE